MEFTDPLGMISSSVIKITKSEFNFKRKKKPKLCNFYVKQESNLPRIKFHVMSVEEEDSGREQSDVEVVDVNLNLIRINVHQSYRSEFRYISRRFLELKNLKL